MAIEINIWLYWLTCSLAMLVIISNQPLVHSLLNPRVNYNRKNSNYKMLLTAGWIATFLASISYVLFTSKNDVGVYQIPDLLAFSLLNGILEQFMFFFWFLLGCYLIKPLVAKNSVWIFVSGYFVFAIFSGFIHALFWLNQLPEHQPATEIVIPLLSIMSGIWMWLFWKYKAVLPVIAMHIFVDIITISHLHYSWFESLQIV